jgi:hypothetical protein
MRHQDKKKTQKDRLTLILYSNDAGYIGKNTVSVGLVVSVVAGIH